jgi:hypothetical protein
MINWMLEVEDAACPVDDMPVGTTDCFTLFRSKGVEQEKVEQGFRSFRRSGHRAQILYKLTQVTWALILILSNLIEP